MTNNGIPLEMFKTDAEPLFAGPMSPAEIFDRLDKVSREALVEPDASQKTFWENFGIPGYLTFSVKTKNYDRGKLTIVDGRRRLWYALDVETEEVEVRIYQYDGLTTAAVGIGMNAARTPNPANEAVLIRQLIDDSKEKGQPLTVSQIAKVTGMPVATIRSRLPFAKLPGDILAAFADGKIKKTVARRIANDPNLVDFARKKIKAGQRVTGKDLDGQRLARAETMFDDLPEELFAPVEVAETPPSPVGDPVVDLVRAAKEAVVYMREEVDSAVWADTDDAETIIENLRAAINALGL